MDREKILQAAKEAGLNCYPDDEEVFRFYAIAYKAGLQKGQGLAGEFICLKCGIRQSGEKVEPNF